MKFSAEAKIWESVSILSIRAIDMSARIKSQMSPPASFYDIRPEIDFDQPYQGRVRFLWSDAAVNIVGEKICLWGLEETDGSSRRYVTQDNIQSNIRLEPGWNAILFKSTTTTDVQGVVITKQIWSALQANELNLWRAP